MGLRRKARQMESQLRGMIFDDHLEEAGKYILNNIPVVIGLSCKIIPQEALTELNFRHICGWPHGSGYYQSENDRKRKEKLREKRWGLELQVLTAKNKRRVARLWEEAKPVVEQRYHRTFTDRIDFSIMGLVYDKIEHLKGCSERLQRVLDENQRFDIIAQESPEWMKVRNMVRRNYFKVHVRDCASHLVGFVKDLCEPLIFFGGKNPDLEEIEEVREDPDPWADRDREIDLTSSMAGHSGNFKRGGFFKRDPDYDSDLDIDNIWHLSPLEYYARIMIEGGTDELSFNRALDFLNPFMAEQFQIKLPHVYIRDNSKPASVEQVALQTLKRRYGKRQEGDECSKFMEQYSRAVLHRWKETAVDHEKLFEFHVPNYSDRDLIALFWFIRQGENVDSGGEQVCIGRYPRLLQQLIEDRVINEEQVVPPLKPKYLAPDEVLTESAAVLGGRKLEEVLQIEFNQEAQTIQTQREVRLLTYEKGQRLDLRDDLSGLESLMDRSKTYEVLYVGDNILFVQSVLMWPNGTQGVGEIFRFARLTDEAVLKDGVGLTLKGKRYHVKKEHDWDLRDRLKESTWDNNADIVPLRTYTAVVDISPEDFKQKYYRDFMAHVFVQGGFTQSPDLERCLSRLDDIEDEDVCNQNWWIGLIGKTNFITFELDKRFGFRIKHKDERGGEEVIFIAKSLTGFLKDCGLRVHQEFGLDEAGRYYVEKKKEERTFQKVNVEEVIMIMQEKGLARIITSAMHDKRYGHYRICEAQEPCEVCGESYFTGGVYRKDLKEQWCDYVDFSNLHSLLRHPQTFKNRFDDFRKIQRLVTDFVDYTPVFVRYPQLLPELAEFAKAYQVQAMAYSEAYRFWEDNRGGVHAEPEELEDDPALKRLYDEEQRLNRAEGKSTRASYKAMQKLQDKYNSVRAEANDTADETKDFKKHGKSGLVSFWSDQVMVFDIYRCYMPTLIGDFKGKEILSQPQGLSTY